MIPFPLYDIQQPRRLPIVNWLLIAICAASFVTQLRAPDGGVNLVISYGFIPARLTTGNRPIQTVLPVIEETPAGPQTVRRQVVLPPAPIAPWLTLITCMFLHGGWLHALGNLWFLHIFGDNVEDRFGHVGYLMLYLATGIAAGLLHYLADRSSTLPTIGASGAIAGVMGSYLLLFPRARVVTLVFIIVIVQMIQLPAYLVLGIWFVAQLVAAATTDASMGGVAWWAHVGGFVAGLILTWYARDVGWFEEPPSDAEPWHDLEDRPYRVPVGPADQGPVERFPRPRPGDWT